MAARRRSASRGPQSLPRRWGGNRKPQAAGLSEYLRGLWPWLGLGGLAWLAATSKPAAATGPAVVPIVAGRKYLFVVRLYPETLEDAARGLLESKSASMIQFAPTSNPPFWSSPDSPEPSSRGVSFYATPAGNSTVTLGDDFYGIGRLERVIGL